MLAMERTLCKPSGGAFAESLLVGESAVFRVLAEELASLGAKAGSCWLSHLQGDDSWEQRSMCPAQWDGEGRQRDRRLSRSCSWPRLCLLSC